MVSSLTFGSGTNNLRRRPDRKASLMYNSEEVLAVGTTDGIIKVYQLDTGS